MTDRPAIVFLPGVMGSRLYFPNSAKFWDPDSTWRMLRWALVWPVRSDDDNRRDLHAREPAGDGTVPALSALAFRVVPERQLTIQGVDHATACTAPRLLSATRTVLG